MNFGLKVVLTSFLWLLVSYMCIAQIMQDSVDYQDFGRVYVYEPAATPSQVVLFISGDAGWRYGVIDMAKSLSEKGALVVGVDILHYFHIVKLAREECHYASGDFENLNEFVQKKYKFSHFMAPILVGYSSGATLAYGLIAQAPAHTYQGGIGIGFCPDLNFNRPLCEGGGLHSILKSDKKSYDLLPRPHLPSPFMVLLGQLDHICDMDTTQKFMETIGNGKLYVLPKVGHGFSNPPDWKPQFIEAYDYVATRSALPPPVVTTDPELKGLPLIEIPAIQKKTDMPLMVCISGDGGWKGFIDKYMRKFADQGIPVIGIDAMRYFWKAKTPESTAADINDIIHHYTSRWQKSKVILLGYSFGANVVPFVINQLPQDIKNNIILTVLLSPENYADFEFHFSSWLDHGSSENYPVVPEIRKMLSIPLIIIYGSKETETLESQFPKGTAQLTTVPGDHHYNYNINAVAQPVLKALDELGQ